VATKESHVEHNESALPPVAGQGAEYVGIMSGAVAVVLTAGVVEAINATETGLARTGPAPWLLVLLAVLVLILGAVLAVSARRFSVYTAQLDTSLGPIT
jgi:hypothetical protein